MTSPTPVPTVDTELKDGTVVAVPKPSETLVVPAGGMVPLKTLDDWRALFHQLVPVVVTSLVGAHLVTDTAVTLWLPYIFAIADPLLSLGNTRDRVRRIVYSVLALLQGGSLITSLTVSLSDHSDPRIAPLIMVAGTIVTGVLGRIFTPTSTMIPKSQIKVVSN